MASHTHPDDKKINYQKIHSTLIAFNKCSVFFQLLRPTGGEGFKTLHDLYCFYFSPQVMREKGEKTLSDAHSSLNALNCVRSVSGRIPGKKGRRIFFYTSVYVVRFSPRILILNLFFWKLC